MNLHRIASVTSAVVLFSGLAAATAHAQTGVFSDATFTVDAAGDVTGTGLGTFLINGTSTVASFTAIATGGSITEVPGVIDDPLTNVSFNISAAPNTILTAGGTGDLIVTSGDLVSFTSSTLGGPPLVTYPGLTLSSIGFTFTATPTPTVSGGTSPTPGVILGGTLNGFGGTDGVVTASFVPEPGTVAMLVGMAVAGTGLGLRRRRRTA
jgi:hypothetical protein